MRGSTQQSGHLSLNPFFYSISMKFCTACKALKISIDAFISLPGSDQSAHLRDPIRSLGRLYDIQRSCMTCPLCHVVFEAFRNGLIYKTANVADLQSVVIFAKWTCPIGPDRARRLTSPSIGILVWAESVHLGARTVQTHNPRCV